MSDHVVLIFFSRWFWTLVMDTGMIPSVNSTLLRGVQTVKRLSATLETWVLSLGWEDPLEKKMETHSSILAWKIPCTEEPGRLQSMGLQKVRYD